MRQDFLKFRKANKQLIESKGVILLQLKIVDLRIRVWFEVAEVLAASFLLGTLFIDQYVYGIFPQSVSLDHETRGPSTY